jgi:hypothetical protein
VGWNIFHNIYLCFAFYKPLLRTELEGMVSITAVPPIKLGAGQIETIPRWFSSREKNTVGSI